MKRYQSPEIEWIALTATVATLLSNLDEDETEIVDDTEIVE